MEVKKETTKVTTKGMNGLTVTPETGKYKGIVLAN
jgi:hypothetical protein